MIRRSLKYGMEVTILAECFTSASVSVLEAHLAHRTGVIDGFISRRPTAFGPGKNVVVRLPDGTELMVENLNHVFRPARLRARIAELLGLPADGSVGTSGAIVPIRSERRGVVPPDAPPQPGVTRVGAWSIHGAVDETGHLTLTVTHDDATPLVGLNWCSGDPALWGERFTTEALDHAARGARDLQERSA